MGNFSQDYVSISSQVINTSIVSSIDIYKIVLIKNKLDGKGIIPTEKWFIALNDYSKQLFAGEDFFELKTVYILTYFKGDINAYDEFARQHFYSNDVFNAPPGEYPFLGEIKIFGNILKNEII